MNVCYAINYGVDSRHLFESGGVFNLKRDAIAAYYALKLKYPYKAANLVRLEFASKYAPATKVETLLEIVY